MECREKWGEGVRERERERWKERHGERGREGGSARERERERQRDRERGLQVCVKVAHVSCSDVQMFEVSKQHDALMTAALHRQHFFAFSGPYALVPRFEGLLVCFSISASSAYAASICFFLAASAAFSRSSADGTTT